MKTKIIYKAFIKTIFAVPLITTFFSCKKDAIPPGDSAYDLNVALRGDGKTFPNGSGYMEFRRIRTRPGLST